MIKLTDLQYTDEDHTCINMTVQVDDEKFPFHYVPYDETDLTKEIKKKLSSKKFAIAPYVPPPPPSSPMSVVSNPRPGKSNVIAD